jgi:gluconate 5-dehydrogenase
MSEDGSGDWLGLRGAHVLVAGAGGLGAACAAGFVEAGAHVTVADADPQRLRAFDGTPEVHPVVADLTTTDGCGELVERAAATGGRLDVFVHAIGRNVRTPIASTTDADWDDIITVNLASAFRLGRAAGARMCAHGYGRQVYFSSVSGLLAHADHGAYAASKGGLDQLLRVMAREWAASGVTVNGVAPGYTETPLTAAHLDRPGVRDALTGLVPAGRLGEPDDVVGPVLFLASRRAGFVTGQVLYVDGGRTLV